MPNLHRWYRTNCVGRWKRRFFYLLTGALKGLVGVILVFSLVSYLLADRILLFLMWLIAPAFYLAEHPELGLRSYRL